MRKIEQHRVLKEASLADPFLLKSDFYHHKMTYIYDLVSNLINLYPFLKTLRAL